LTRATPPEVVEAVDAITHRAGESYDEYIERVATNEISRRVKLADLRENLANNRRLPRSAANAERIARYERQRGYGDCRHRGSKTSSHGFAPPCVTVLSRPFFDDGYLSASAV
jgi:hypothetical protein